MSSTGMTGGDTGMMGGDTGMTSKKKLLFLLLQLMNKTSSHHMI
ncbi:hypothetical protein N499_0306 [Wolbachia pipientis wVitA]|nr:hypothetical protein [Wolbachia endosymbiont of Phyllotreta cruciferae]ONI58029.1 hypothetical protein N499_0306 [Wolbachia pipientis wVitA]